GCPIGAPIDPTRSPARSNSPTRPRPHWPHAWPSLSARSRPSSTALGPNPLPAATPGDLARPAAAGALCPVALPPAAAGRPRLGQVGGDRSGSVSRLTIAPASSGRWMRWRSRWWRAVLDDARAVAELFVQIEGRPRRRRPDTSFDPPPMDFEPI